MDPRSKEGAVPQQKLKRKKNIFVPNAFLQKTKLASRVGFKVSIFQFYLTLRSGVETFRPLFSKAVCDKRMLLPVTFV